MQINHACIFQSQIHACNTNTANVHHRNLTQYTNADMW